VVKPRQRFLEWLQAADPTSSQLTLSDLEDEPTIYLIPECDTSDDVAEALRELCDAMFVDQLDAWYQDKSRWPKDRSFEVFCQWFDFQHHSMLVDICGDRPLGSAVL
jgi:hypothetical protein